MVLSFPQFRRSGLKLDETVQRNDARKLRQQALPAGLTMHCGELCPQLVREDSK